jgi:histidinol-phosphate aminotransferase
MNIDLLVRPNIRKLKPYSSARSLYQSGVFFDANENALGSTAELPGYLELNRYPDPCSANLRKALSEYVGVPAKNVFAGNGSDEVIDLLIRIFVNPNEAIAIMEPTYGMYRVAADTAGVGVVSYNLDDEFQIDLASLWKNLNPNIKIIFLCSPNNPTGNLMRREDIREICTRFSGIVVVDEAYIEFASAPSLVKEIRAYPNLIIMRTFSKAWGLAGVRVGYAVANKKTIEYLDKVKPPYNINRISSRIAIGALKNRPAMTQMREVTLKERAGLVEALWALGFKVFPSDANFLLVKYSEISKVARNLAEQDGLIIRDFGNKPMLNDCVRISVGSPEQNALLINSLAKRL